jgi:hypothetical protein
LDEQLEEIRGAFKDGKDKVAEAVGRAEKIPVIEEL